jgi:hypothetical protein
VRVETAPIIFIVVDLPAPFGPSRPNDSPGATSKERPSTARKSGLPLTLYAFARFDAEMTGAGTEQP